MAANKRGPATDEAGAPEGAGVQSADMQAILAGMESLKHFTENQMAALVERLNHVEENQDMMHANLHATGSDRDASGQHEPEMRDDIYVEMGMLSTHQLPPRAGFVRRWVRTAMGNESDAANLSKRLNGHWTPVSKSAIPEGTIMPCIKHGDSEVIGFHGNILMERPLEIHERQRRGIRQQNVNQDRAVEHQLHAVHDSSQRGLGRPQMDRQSSYEVGRRSPADDSDG